VPGTWAGYSAPAMNELLDLVFVRSLELAEYAASRLGAAQRQLGAPLFCLDQDEGLCVERIVTAWLRKGLCPQRLVVG